MGWDISIKFSFVVVVVVVVVVCVLLLLLLLLLLFWGDWGGVIVFFVCLFVCLFFHQDSHGQGIYFKSPNGGFTKTSTKEN